MTPGEARERFAAAAGGAAGHRRRRGRPHLVPMVFAVDGDRIYSAVDAKPKRTLALRRLANVRENPAVSLLVDQYDDATGTRCGGSARTAGDGCSQPDDEEARRAVELLRERYPQQRAAGAVLAVDVEHWRGWTAQG